MGMLRLALILIAGTAGGALNSVAGGGSFLTFPALIFAGIAPIEANATSTLAMWPASLASAVAYHGEPVERRLCGSRCPRRAWSAACSERCS